MPASRLARVCARGVGAPRVAGGGAAARSRLVRFRSAGMHCAPRGRRVACCVIALLGLLLLWAAVRATECEHCYRLGNYIDFYLQRELLRLMAARFPDADASVPVRHAAGLRRGVLLRRLLRVHRWAAPPTLIETLDARPLQPPPASLWEEPQARRVARGLIRGAPTSRTYGTAESDYFLWWNPSALRVLLPCVRATLRGALREQRRRRSGAKPLLPLPAPLQLHRRAGEEAAAATAAGVPPRACESWCADHRNREGLTPWSTKCTWHKCWGCDACSVDQHVTPAVAAQTAATAGLFAAAVAPSAPLTARTCVVHFRAGDFTFEKLGGKWKAKDVRRATRAAVLAARTFPLPVERFELLSSGLDHHCDPARADCGVHALDVLVAGLRAEFTNASVVARLDGTADDDFLRMADAPMLLLGSVGTHTKVGSPSSIEPADTPTLTPALPPALAPTLTATLAPTRTKVGSSFSIYAAAASTGHVRLPGCFQRYGECMPTSADAAGIAPGWRAYEHPNCARCRPASMLVEEAAERAWEQAALARAAANAGREAQAAPATSAKRRGRLRRGAWSFGPHRRRRSHSGTD